MGKFEELRLRSLLFIVLHKDNNNLSYFESPPICLPYGYRKDPFTGKRKFHNGIDLHARSSKVFAMMQGRVIAVGQDKVSGKHVTLRHENFTVSYCHLSQISVSQGQDVLSGDVVGITGNTGRSTGEHLHITIRQKGEYVNPRIFLDYINSVKESCVMELVKNII